MKNEIVRLPGGDDGGKRYPLTVTDAVFDRNGVTSTSRILQDEAYKKGFSQKVFDRKICILAAGQSNMEGMIPKSLAPSYIAALGHVLPKCLYVKNNSSNNPVFSILATPEKWAFDMITYYCLTELAGEDIYVIKYSMGGTSIDKDGTNSFHWTVDYEELDDLNHSLLLSFNKEIERCCNLYGDNFDIRAFVWHQGEGDYMPGVSEKYYNNLKRVIAYIRGVAKNPILPFITGTIPRSSDQYSSVVYDAQVKLANEDKYFWLIDLSSATLMDNYHFDARSAEYFGKQVYNKLIDAGVIYSDKIDAGIL